MRLNPLCRIDEKFRGKYFPAALLKEVFIGFEVSYN